MNVKKNQANKIKRQIPVINKSPKKKYYPVSLQQEGIWLQAFLDPENAVWNISHSWRFKGPLNVNALKEAIRELIRRQKILGMRFLLIKEKIYQCFAENIPIDSFFKYVDLSTHPEEEKETAAQWIEKNEARKPYDLAAGPLIHFTLIRRALSDHVLIISKHHIITDVTSRQILWRELVTLYNAHASGTPHRLDSPDIQYYDYAVWQQEFMESENYKQQKVYWLTQLSDPPPLLDLPTDYPRKENARLKISFFHMDLNPQLAANLRTFGLRSRVLFSATFLLAFYILLNKYSGQKDILIGNIFRGRDPSKNKLNKIVGLFINCLAMRLDTTEVDANDDINVRELLDLVNKKTRETYNNQDFLFEDLIRTIQQSYAKNTFPFQAVFNMIKAPPVGVEWQELTKKERQGVERDTTFTAQCDLSLYVRDELNNNNINIKILYPEDLFKKETIKRMLIQYINILMEIVEQPARKFRHLQIITKEEKHRIMNHFNDTSKEYPFHKTIHGLFEEQAEQTPLHIVLVAPEIEQIVEPSDVPIRNINAHVTYKELNRRANQLARLLRAKGVGPDTVVGIMAARSAEVIIGMYGILKAGGACLLLDPGFPPERLKYMIQDNGISLLVSQHHLLRTIGIKPGNLEVVDLFDPAVYRQKIPGSNLETVNINRSSDLAYIIYTSGSTGRPKGIMIEHRSLHNYINGTVEAIDFSPGKIILSYTTITFDIFVLEIYLPLARGLRVVMADENLQWDSAELAVLLKTHLVEMFQTTPTRMQLVIDHGRNLACLEGLKEILIGGEAFPEKMLEDLKSLPFAKIYNMYGPTETTVWSTIKDLTIADTIDVGKPLANDSIYILDKYLNLQPIGVVGEIYFAGHGLARGYLNNPFLTHDTFVSSPFEPGQRMYKSGDLGRWMADGNIQFFGRIDHQVKINGHRIELGEIETLLDYHPAVQNSVVTVRQFQGGDRRLVAYIVKNNKENNRNLIDTLRQYLHLRLPVDMVPAVFMMMETFPLTSSGKINRHQLPDPHPQSLKSESLYVPPRDTLERQLTGIWEKVLKVKPIGLTEDFFKLGGYSLLAVQLFSRIEKELGYSLSAATLFKASTVEQQAAVIRQVEFSSQWTAIVPLQASGSGIPVFLMHHADGGVIDYQELVQQMGKEHPIYGLQSVQSFAFRLPRHQIKAIAAQYVEEICKFYPQGPCIIGGHSFGGWLAFEVACQLKTLGQEVALLVLIDTCAPGSQLLPILQRIGYIVLSYIEKIKFHTRRLFSIPLNQRWNYFLAKSRVVLKRVRRQVKRMYKKAVKRLKTAGSSEKMAKKNPSNLSSRPVYIPGLYPGQAVLFKSAVPLPVDDKETYGWGKYITGSLEVYKVTGEHGNLTKAPHVCVLAEKLNACIRISSCAGQVNYTGIQYQA